MNKKLLTAAVLGALTLSATSVFASPITFSGDGYLQYNNTQQAPSSFNWHNLNGVDARYRLNVDGDIADNLHAHVRFVQEQDISTSYAANQARMDEAYVAGKFDNVNVQVGKDDLFTGKGLLIDDHQFTGIKANTDLDGFKMGGFYGKDNGLTKTATADIGGALGDVNLGANYVLYGTTHYYGINADTKIGDAVVNTEYVKNDTSAAKGYIAGVTMGAYTVSYRDIDNGAVPTFHTTNLNYDNSKGFKVSAHYNVNKNSSVTLYQDFAKDQAGVDKQRTNVEYDFGF
jgi:hypothetical protein